MSTMACEIIGTGDCELKSRKNESTASKVIVNDLVSEIIDNALDQVDDVSDTRKIMECFSEEDEYKSKAIDGKEKSGTRLIGTGDQKSNVIIDQEETVIQHPPVEKKNRLTDLVKNSKQILAKIMMSESRSQIREENEEKIIDVIELDCVRADDVQFKIKYPIEPEKVPLPRNDSHEILTPPINSSLDEIRLSDTGEENKETQTKKTMTFPRSSGTRAKAAFAAKCRTLKIGATNLKKKKWDVGGKIASFFRKKKGGRCGKDEGENEKGAEA